jgi:predicted amidophosphoribosyltransferase
VLDLLDVLLPRRCTVCSAGGHILCAACRAALPRIRPPLCACCGAPTAWPVARCRECSGRRLSFVLARAAAAYEGHTRLVVTAWKERGVRLLARDAAAVVAERLEPPSVDALTFVPADRGRRLDRGHHPAEQLARELGRVWALPCAPLLRRRGPARRQRGLALAERRRNVRGGFVAAELGPARRICVVDDVYTSGATVDAAAAALRGAGAERVEVVTFARTIRGSALGLGKRR